MASIKILRGVNSLPVPFYVFTVNRFSLFTYLTSSINNHAQRCFFFPDNELLEGISRIRGCKNYFTKTNTKYIRGRTKNPCSLIIGDFGNTLRVRIASLRPFGKQKFKCAVRFFDKSPKKRVPEPSASGSTGEGNVGYVQK